jgi:hypothetical protein
MIVRFHAACAVGFAGGRVCGRPVLPDVPIHAASAEGEGALCVVRALQLNCKGYVFVLSDVASAGDRFDLMKLALPSFVVWLLGFYTMFHCCLNITGELTRFADRQFYKGMCACRLVCSRGRCSQSLILSLSSTTTITVTVAVTPSPSPSPSLSPSLSPSPSPSPSPPLPQTSGMRRPWTSSGAR